MRIKTSSLYKVLWWYNNVTLLLPLLMREDNLTQGLQKVTCQERLNTDSRIMRKLPMLSLTLMIIVLEFCPFLCCMSGETLLYEHLDQPAGAAGGFFDLLVWLLLLILCGPPDCITVTSHQLLPVILWIIYHQSPVKDCPSLRGPWLVTHCMWNRLQLPRPWLNGYRKWTCGNEIIAEHSAT